MNRDDSAWDIASRQNAERSLDLKSAERSLARFSLSDFTVLGELSAGMSSVVYRARHVSSGKEMALKCCFASRLTPKTLGFVRDEIALHSALHHPAIVSFYGSFEDRRGNVYIVLELAKRGDLFSAIFNRTHVESEIHTCRRVIRPLVSAVAHLHARGIVHRDIKAENVLVTDDGTSVKLADFGFAVDFTRHRPVTRLGTVAYMAPEIIRCDADARRRLTTAGEAGYGPEVDCWAVGVLAYECLVGETPFGETTLDEAFDAIIRRTGSLFAASRSNRTPSPDAEDFILGCLRLDPKLRLTAREMLSHPWIVTHDVAPFRASSYTGRVEQPIARIASKRATGATETSLHDPPPPRRVRSFASGMILNTTRVLVSRFTSFRLGGETTPVVSSLTTELRL